MSLANFDFVVIGGGMVGAATACLLSRANFSVALVEPGDPPEYDESIPVGLRVSAISPGSESILGHTGAWRIISERRHCPYRKMHVEEDDEASALEFTAPEFGMERLGTIVENDSIGEALWRVLEARRTAGDQLSIYQPARLENMATGPDGVLLELENGEQLGAKVVVGADGPQSRVRGIAGITQKTWHYGQRGLVGVVRAERSNPAVAWQRFMEGGPLAFLPLNDGSSSIVWTRPVREAERLLSLDEEEFCEALSVASGNWLGDIKSCGPRAAFDLTMRLSERYCTRRTVLVGDAAHVVHPLAGQGVNLGFLDAAALVELFSAARDEDENWDSEELLNTVLERYQRWRRSDAEIMARGIHGIRALFEPPILAPVRRLGMRLVGKSWMAREAFLMRAAGRHQDAPALARKPGTS